jgi:thiol-disulfide isomerase/thioredoxin
MMIRLPYALCLLSLLACSPTPEAPEGLKAPPPTVPRAVPTPPPLAVEVPTRAPEVRAVPHTLESTVQAHVVSELAEAKADGRQLVVYVGAPWCEPCRRFHDAVVAGELNAPLDGVRFLEFDHDAHQDGLKSAGYLRRFVPLFAIPKPDGAASKRLHQGAIKGPGAVDFILPHLTTLLSEGAQPPPGG